MHDPAEAREIRRLLGYARWLDDIIRLPGGYRIGLDGIIGLIPGAGDIIGGIASSFIIAQAARLGVPTGVLLRMVGNVLVDSVIGLVPILGDLFDMAWKANLRNLQLLERHAGRSSMGERGQTRLAWLVGALVVLIIVGFVALGWLLIAAIVSLAA